MLSIQDKVSSYSYNLTLLNLAKAMSWKVIQKDSNFIAYQSQIEYGFLVENMRPNTLNCDCYFSKSMGLPCDHILACLIHMPETKTNKIYVENLIKCFNERWELSEEKEDEKLLNFIKEFQFVPKKLIKKSKNQKSTADQMEEKKSKIKIILSENKIERILKQEKSEEEEEKNSQNRYNLTNPPVVVTCGRPPQEKRTPSYVEIYAKKRKAEASVTHEKLKATKLFQRNSL